MSHFSILCDISLLLFIIIVMHNLFDVKFTSSRCYMLFIYDMFKTNPTPMYTCVCQCIVTPFQSSLFLTFPVFLEIVFSSSLPCMYGLTCFGVFGDHEINIISIICSNIPFTK